MRLYEYQAKELLRKEGVTVPKSIPVTTLEAASKAAESLSSPVMLKAQVLQGGRGKAGAIVKASSMVEVETAFKKLMATPISGATPSLILMEEFLPHTREIYLSVVLDRGKRCYVMIISAEGGVEVENVGEKHTLELRREVDELRLDRVASELKLNSMKEEFKRIAKHLVNVANNIEAELVEINPLVFDDNGRAVALDAKIITDDNALFRHPEIANLIEKGSLEAQAERRGFSFVELDGDIAVVGNGAGLVLSSLDLVSDAGGKPACFLDLGGGSSAETVKAAVKLVGEWPKANTVFLNIFGGITRCEDVATGLIAALEEGSLTKKVYARISGAGEEQARMMLKDRPIKMYSSAKEAVTALIASTR
jgi:succinyl-CoA synthetase beta subunit